MPGYILLKILLVAVILENQRVCAQDVVFDDVHSVYFPKNEETVNRRVENIPQPLPQPPNVEVRARVRPPCEEALDPTNSQSSPCLRDTQYNENVQRLISQLLSQSPSINDIIHDPMLRVILNDTLTRTEGIFPSTRFGGPSETPVCNAQEELIFPQRAKTPKQDWVFVVNQPGVKQALRVEKCTGEGRPCNFGVRERGDVTTVCRQKYVYRRMLILGTNNIEPEEVLMPSCCVCYIRRENIDILTRININATEGENLEDPVPLRQPTPNGAQAAIHLTFQPKNPDRPHKTHLPNGHSHQRRGLIYGYPSITFQPMRYK